MAAQIPAETVNERLEPVLQFSVLCDAVAQDPNNRKFSLFGLFDKILFPSVMQQFFVVNKWNNGQGNFRQTVEILKPDLSPAVPPAVQTFALPSRTDGGAVVAVGFLLFNFSEPGVWWVQVKLDDELVIAYPLPVNEPSGVTTQTT